MEAIRGLVTDLVSGCTGYIQLLRNMQMVNTGASQNRRNDGESAAPADSYEDVHGEGEESQSSRSY